MHTELGSQAIPLVMSVERADTFFSHVPMLEACLLLRHCLSLQEHATDAWSLAQKQYNRGGRKKHGSHLDGGQEKAAGRTNSRLCREGGNKRGFMGRAAVIYFSLSRICEPGLSLMEIAS